MYTPGATCSTSVLISDVCYLPFGINGIYLSLSLSPSLQELPRGEALAREAAAAQGLPPGSASAVAEGLSPSVVEKGRWQPLIGKDALNVLSKLGPGMQEATAASPGFTSAPGRA